ncbi:D-serine ammonia-lyase [Shouchella sp. JSM 1781072]|uniref:D-serine ammonia-lyase n=1 Tax=Bacillaceae TaxID=186817 RepID=UPI000C075708|nr:MULTISPECIES: D-serine ammonia-lyase [Bacillaceae]UTR07602.1 D-serine ammonia-lyase [Alkalihalobacillus sp. LMS6]
MNKQELIETFPALHEVVSLKETFWENPLKNGQAELKDEDINMQAIEAAEARLQRFAPYLKKVFPETEATNGLLESPLKQIDDFKEELEHVYNEQIVGKLFLKCDHVLPISGSIKARGGIYEVLTLAESILLKHEVLKTDENYEKIADSSIHDLLSSYTIVVGSTGNLGLSIGVMAKKLGFHVVVHMSNDAKSWKKELLKQRGAVVVEHQQDYSLAVEEGRKQAEQDEMSFFIDDEQSKTLFLGYAVAALRLKKQLDQAGISINANQPLFVYLPCGVGGGPGGIAYGLYQVFGPHVHCYFAEPTHAPCMLIGMMTRLHDQIHVQDLGIDNRTIADGLAVGRPSGFVGKVMEPILSGIYTVSDDTMYQLLATLIDKEDTALEPSAVTSLVGPVKAKTVNRNGIHLSWATGGSMVPDAIMSADYEKGKALQST